MSHPLGTVRSAVVTFNEEELLQAVEEMRAIAAICRMGHKHDYDEKYTVTCTVDGREVKATVLSYEEGMQLYTVTLDGSELDVYIRVVNYGSSPWDAPDLRAVQRVATELQYNSMHPDTLMTALNRLLG